MAVEAIAFGSPKSLINRVNFEIAELGGDFDLDEASVADLLISSDANDTARKRFHFSVLRWDSEHEPEWTAGLSMPRHGEDRRRTALELLGFDEASQDKINNAWPPQSERDIVISGNWSRWYLPDRERERAFYWPHYRDTLGDKKWSESALSDLDASTSEVVRRLADPLADSAFQSKGLVVGYVQSGKTAHFTGVAAKAIDAGYRLVIVLGGTLDLLRNQTQRRLDMELVGVPGILGGKDPDDFEQRFEIDYLEDDDWLNGRFVTHGGVRPSDAGFPDIRRLTGAKFDFQQLKGGLSALDFRAELRDKSKPIYDRENLFATDARLIVLKKHPGVLKRLVKDLRAITANLAEIPALVIDDESDQASVSTVSPGRQNARTTEAKIRTATNQEITKLLGLLPRSQYIGYTATPFANVFVDPDDVEDIFPKDFVIALKRPEGYMGAADFHDFDELPPGETRTFSNSNRMAHVRDLVATGDDDSEAELLRALDTFVLSGAIKLFRATVDSDLKFRHHTMLIHETTRQVDHAALAERVDALWHSAGFASASGLVRLEELWRTDFEPVSAARGRGLPVPENFDALRLFITQTVGRVTQVGPPVLVVNGDNDLEKYRGELDFDTTDVWRILVGGTKLSRGFTVEGLTVSYYKRRSLQADTLMQMGRWFGFRYGYSDLVRLFIDRLNVVGSKTFDLYEAFESMVIDEESFRDELRRYAELSLDGEPVVTPREIPPLVTQHLPWLQPTSRSKRYNAVLVERGDGGQVKDLALLPNRGDGTANARNFEALHEILTSPRQTTQFRSDFNTPYQADYTIVDNATFVRAIELMQFDDSFDRKPQLTFIKNAGSAGLIQDWAIIMPMLDPEMIFSIGEYGRLGLTRRKRRTEENRVGFSGSSTRQRPAVSRIAGVEHPSVDDPEAARLYSPTRGAVLITSILDPKEAEQSVPSGPEDVALLLSYAAPYNSAPKGKLGFTVVSKGAGAIVDK
jgi:hypothetical protein